MKKQLLTFLGKDSGFGIKNNSAYIEEQNNLIIIDCGFTVFQQIKELIDLTRYNSIYVIITHLHNDHAGSLSQLILYSWFVLNKKITVVSKCEKIKEYLDITGTPPFSYNLERSLNNIEFIKTEHTKYIDAYGFKANIRNKTIVYTGDTNTIEPFMSYLDNADELYIDVSRYGGAHLKIDEVFEQLKNIKEKGVDICLMHLDDEPYIKKLTQAEFSM